MKKNNINTKKQVIVLGGGLAGLAAAYELTRNDYSVTVIEEQDDVGGLARTFEKNGFHFDTGPHRWYTKSDMVNNWMLDFMGDEIIKIPRLTRIYFDKKFFYYPIRFKNVITGMGLIKATQAVLDYLWVRLLARIRKLEAVTLEDGYVDKFGNTLYETFFRRYSEKLWGVSCKKISADWIGQRTRGFNIGTILKETLFRSKGVVSFIDEFSYPKKGIGRIAQKLAQKIEEQKGTILLNARVTKVLHKDNRVTDITFVQNGKTRVIAADFVVSTIPLSDAVFSLAPKAPKEIEDIAQRLTYRDEVQVTLFINKQHITPDTWIYVHPKEISFMRVMEMTNWNINLSPKGQTSMIFEIACNEGDATWHKKDAELINMVTKEFITEFQLVNEKDIIGGYVHRMPKEYPVYHVGYKEDVAIIKQYLQKFENFQIAGRNGTFRYNNMDHSIEMGLYAAWNIIAGRQAYDIESVNIEREYLEEKKLELPEDEYVEEEDQH